MMVAKQLQLSSYFLSGIVSNEQKLTIYEKGKISTNDPCQAFALLYTTFILCGHLGSLMLVVDIFSMTGYQQTYVCICFVPALMLLSCFVLFFRVNSAPLFYCIIDKT